MKYFNVSFKIQIVATVQDDIVSTDEVQERIEAFEDDVQSVDIVAFNRCDQRIKRKYKARLDCC